jgi:chromosome segregation ATPase
MEAPQAKSVTLQTISEHSPLRANTTSHHSVDTTQLHGEIAALKAQCAALQEQRNEAFAELDKALSAPQDQVNAYIKKIKELEAQRNEAISQRAAMPQEQASAYLAKIQELETQRNDAFEALDQVFSAPQPPPQHTQYMAQISELKAQKRVLEERCKTFSGWAEQLRLESSRHAADSQRHKQTCNELNEALSEFYTKHTKLCAQHTELETKMEELRLSRAATSTSFESELAEKLSVEQAKTVKALAKTLEEQAKTLKAQKEAVAAEKTVQTLLGVRTLVQSAPVALELSLRTRSILESTIDVLSLANQASTPKTVQACLTQVCSALATLGDEAAGHSVAAKGWLAKRDSVLKSSREHA